MRTKRANNAIQQRLSNFFNNSLKLDKRSNGGGGRNGYRVRTPNGVSQIERLRKCHFFKSTSISCCIPNIDCSKKKRNAPIFLVSLLSKIARCRSSRMSTRDIVACQLREDPVFDLGAVREQIPTTARLGRPASTGIHTRPVEPVGGTRRRPDVTAQISATPVQDLSPFPEPGQSALASHRPSRCEGGTAPELRFSTFLSRVAHPTDEGGYPVRQLPPLMLSSVAAVERSQPQPPPTAPTPTAADPKLISNSSKRKGSEGGGGTRRWAKIHLPFSVMSVYGEKRFRSRKRVERERSDSIDQVTTFIGTGRRFRRRGGSGGRRRGRKTKERLEEREKERTKRGGSEEKEQYKHSVAPIPIEMAPDRNTPCTRHTIYPGPHTRAFDFLFFPQTFERCAAMMRKYDDVTRIHTRDYAIASHS
ncbi:hypothetical protein G5I_12913 [Acromyrmex echinatior]|uniref:Uncharacterized protein n=1 Tax=Acromyrmex echinatior TaxID=103372 RepID=F4X410_ACREC|nr:hypothetical protein G5I_12913 [Acromyrmex echinatior]